MDDQNSFQSKLLLTDPTILACPEAAKRKINMIHFVNAIDAMLLVPCLFIVVN
jgi:hypothetical protein